MVPNRKLMSSIINTNWNDWKCIVLKLRDHGVPRMELALNNTLQCVKRVKQIKQNVRLQLFRLRKVQQPRMSQVHLSCAAKFTPHEIVAVGASRYGCRANMAVNSF